MAWARSATGSWATNAFGSSVTPTLPGTWSPGDLGLIVVTGYPVPATPNTPSGWTSINVQSGTNDSVWLFGRILQSGDTIPSITWGSSQNSAAACAMAYSGAPATLTGMVDIESDAGQNSTQNLATTSNLTPGANGELVLYGAVRAKTSTSDSSTFTAPANFSTISQFTLSGTRAAGILCDWIQTTATAWGSAGAAGSVADGTTQPTRAFRIALKPGAGAALAGSAAAATSSMAALTTAIQAVGSAQAGISVAGALTNWATVTLAAPLYTGPGGILDPNFWRDVQPGVGSVLYYDATNITIYPNGEISSTTNNCSAVVQFFDGQGWSVGVVILTPQMVSYASVVAAAAATLTTSIVMAGAAIASAAASGNVTTGIQLAGNALAVANAAAALTTGVQLNAAALANVTAQGALTGGQASLQGAANTLSQALAALTTKIQLAGQVAVNSTVAGGLSAQIVLSGAANTLTQANAQVSTGILLAGNANVVTTGAGAALLTTSFAGAANAVSTALGSLLTGLLVAGNALVQVSAGGSLSTGITLAGGAVVDTASAFKPPGLEAQFGRAEINILSPTGLPVDLSVFIAGSACIATIDYFNAKGEPFVPSEVFYSVQDVSTGFTIVPAAQLTPELSNAVTITGQQNMMINLSRSFEMHQILFQIIDGLGQVYYDSKEFELVRKPGVN